MWIEIVTDWIMAIFYLLYILCFYPLCIQWFYQVELILHIITSLQYETMLKFVSICYKWITYSTSNYLYYICYLHITLQMKIKLALCLPLSTRFSVCSLCILWSSSCKFCEMCDSVKYSAFDHSSKCVKNTLSTTKIRSIHNDLCSRFTQIRRRNLSHPKLFVNNNYITKTNLMLEVRL